MNDRKTPRDAAKITDVAPLHHSGSAPDTFDMPDKPPALPPIPSVSKITEVVEAIESIIDWSIGASSRLGYFAALYRRITIAVRTAVGQAVFQDAPRIERLDVTFASRYFEALNGYFHPGKFPKPTRSWQVTLNAASRAEPIILQHMLAGVNVHIGLDLGIAAQSIGAGGQLPAGTVNLRSCGRSANHIRLIRHTRTW